MTRYRSWTGADYEAAARILAESSRGKPYDFGDLDRWGLIGLSSFWRFALNYSYIVERDGEPVALIIACVDDPATREAFAYYLGLMPTVQGGGAGAKLSRQLLLDLQRDGFHTLFAETTFGSPREMFERLGARITHEVRLLRGDLETPVRDPRVEVLPFDRLDEWYRPPAPLLWCERPAFLRSSARHLTAIRGASGGLLIFSGGGHVLHLELPTAHPTAAALDLISWVLAHTPERPLHCSGIRPDSLEQHALLELGFSIQHASHGLAWDLTQPLPFR